MFESWLYCLLPVWSQVIQNLSFIIIKWPYSSVPAGIWRLNQMCMAHRKCSTHAPFPFSEQDPWEWAQTCKLFYEQRGQGIRTMVTQTRLSLVGCTAPGAPLIRTKALVTDDLSPETNSLAWGTGCSRKGAGGSENRLCLSLTDILCGLWWWSIFLVAPYSPKHGNNAKRLYHQIFSKNPITK